MLPTQRLRLFAASALLAGIALATPAGAEEPARARGSAAAQPPVFPAELVLEVEAKPIDPQAWLAALRGQLERMRTPPPTSPQDTQLKSAWETILQPRLGNMISRLEPWQESARWVVITGDPTFVTLRDDQWAPFIQSIAALTAELQGALQQYGNVKIRRRVQPEDVGAVAAWRLAYPTDGLYTSILQRQAAAQRVAARRLATHGALFGRFRQAWDWSWDQSSAWIRYIEEQEAAAAQEAIERGLEEALQATKQNLTGLLLGVQAFVASVQESEHARLRSLCVACRTDDATLREMAETALRGMETAQLDAERFQAGNYTKYNGMLRAWHRQQRAAVGVLELTQKRLQDDVTSEPQPAGSQPAQPAQPQQPAPPVQPPVPPAR
jgi:hypothetical protein